MGDKYVAGTMTFGEAPRVDALNILCEGFSDSFTRLVAMAPSGNAMTARPCNEVPFAMHIDMPKSQPGWLDELRRESYKSGADGVFDDLLAGYLCDEMAEYFDCDVSGRVLDRATEDANTLQLVGRLAVLSSIELSNRQRMRFERRAAFRDEPEDIAQQELAVTSLDDALAKLDGLIGLDSVKGQIHDIVSIVKNRGKDASPCMHMVFTGNPGTGKTEVARIIGEVFAALGVIESAKFVETDRAGLVGEYVGHTAQKTKRVIEEAMGGVLFIDEAYALGMYSGGDLGASPNGGRRVDFGLEEISTLIKAMEDHRDEFVCIMAGYPREMEQMIAMNPGMRDRIGFFVGFDDYTAGELTCIFEYMMRERGYELGEQALELARKRLARIEAEKDDNFSNARIVRKIAERAIFKQNVRCSGNVIEREDIEAAFADGDLAALGSSAAKVPFGFARA